MLMWMWIKSMSAILPEAVQSSARAQKESGVSSHKVIYNMDCIGTLPSRNLRLADNTIDQYVPQSEVFLGYRYVPR